MAPPVVNARTGRRSAKTIATFPERSRPRLAIQRQRLRLSRCLLPGELKDRERLSLACDSFAVPWSVTKRLEAACFKATPAGGGASFGLPKAGAQGRHMGAVDLLAGRT